MSKPDKECVSSTAARSAPLVPLAERHRLRVLAVYDVEEDVLCQVKRSNAKRRGGKEHVEPALAFLGHRAGPAVAVRRMRHGRRLEVAAGTDGGGARGIPRAPVGLPSRSNDLQKAYHSSSVTSRLAARRRHPAAGTQHGPLAWPRRPRRCRGREAAGQPASAAQPSPRAPSPCPGFRTTRPNTAPRCARRRHRARHPLHHRRYARPLAAAVEWTQTSKDHVGELSKGMPPNHVKKSQCTSLSEIKRMPQMGSVHRYSLRGRNDLHSYPKITGTRDRTSVSHRMALLARRSRPGQTQNHRPRTQRRTTLA